MKRCRQGNGRKGSSSNKKFAKEETKISDLCTHVLMEIFLRLPAMAIIYCKCVCKSWYDLLSDNCFGNLYGKNPSYVDLVFTNIKKTLYSSDPDGQADGFHLLEFGEGHDSSQKHICHRKLNLPRRDCMMVCGSCSGLLCLVQHTNNSSIVHISNPMTGEYISLPRLSSGRKLWKSAYGFGFDTHYKALRIFTLQHGNGEVKVEGQIFTIGVDKKWRTLVDTSRIYHLQGFAVIVSGTFHWVVSHRFAENHPEGNLVMSNMIYAFTIREERFKLIQPPPPLTISIANYSPALCLGLLRNSLCVFDNSRADTHLDIWTMREYGKAESWTKDCILKSCIPCASLHPCVHTPITTWRDGEILLYCFGSPDLISYNPRQRNAYKLAVSGFERLSYPQVMAQFTTFIPSFVSLREVFKARSPRVQKVLQNL